MNWIEIPSGKTIIFDAWLGNFSLCFLICPHKCILKTIENYWKLSKLSKSIEIYRKLSKMIDKTVYLLLFLYCLQRAFFVLLRIFIFLPFDNFFFYDTFGNRWIVPQVIWSERKNCISGKHKCTGNPFSIFIVFNSFHHPHFVALRLTLPTFYWKRKVFFSLLVVLIREDFKFANII